MKVLLIHPYISFDSEDYIQALSEPLGLLYIATYLQKHFGSTVNVKILDLYAMGYTKKNKRGDGRIVQGISSENKIIKLINNEQPDIIVISNEITKIIVEMVVVFFIYTASSH